MSGSAVGDGGGREPPVDVAGDASSPVEIAAGLTADPVRQRAAAEAIKGGPLPALTERRQGERRMTWLGRPGHVRHQARTLIPRLLERGLHRVTEAPLIPGNGAQLLVDAPAAYPAMLELIASATETVCFENYIIRDDAVGHRFAEALMERARAGVQVRVLYDWLGSARTSRSFWRRLRHAGCDVLCFGGPSASHPGRVFTRDHRKLLVVDGCAGIVGGFCIGAEWEDDRSLGPWRDTAVRVDGPVCVEMERAFARTWRRTGGSMPERALGEHPQPRGDVAIRVVDGPPAHARTYRLYQLLAALAERTLYVTGAYPLAPTALRRALVSAARGGVDVRLLVPDRSDLRALNQAGRAHYTRLLRNGVRIFLWEGPMLHAKTLVVDGMLALIGSSNLNPFSMLGCYELDLQLQDPGIADALQQQFLRDLERSREIKLEQWKHRPARERLQERLGAGLLWLPYKLYSG